MCIFVLFVLFVRVKYFHLKNKTALIPSFILLLRLPYNVVTSFSLDSAITRSLQQTVETEMHIVEWFQKIAFCISVKGHYSWIA